MDDIRYARLDSYLSVPILFEDDSVMVVMITFAPIKRTTAWLFIFCDGFMWTPVVLALF